MSAVKQFVPIAIAVWIPVIIILFGKLPKHRAVIVAFVAGILFLPGLLEKKITEDAPNVFALPFLPLTKQNVICLSVLIAAVAHDRARVLAFRFHRFDLFMMFWCLCPMFSALANDPPEPYSVYDPDAKFGKLAGVYIGPIYDGFSQARIQFLNWGVPYIIGRMYFNNFNAMKELVIGMLLGALVYVPFCLFEWKMGPMSHSLVYGFEQHEASQSVRGDRFRPVVFMEHGLAVGMWLSATMLAAFWLWYTDSLKFLKPTSSNMKLPMIGIFALLFGVSVIIKSGGAFMLGLLGLGGLIAISKIGPRPVIICIAILGPLYMVGRLTSQKESTGWTKETYNRWQNEGELEDLENKSLDQKTFSWGWWSTKEMANFVSNDKDRQGSFTFRLVNEDRLMEKTAHNPAKPDQPWYRPLFGWGGWDRSDIKVKVGDESIGEQEKEENLIKVDSLWIITYANRGLVGVILLYAAMLYPMLRLAWIYPKSYWVHPTFASVAVGAIFVTLWMFDNVLNNMFNPVYVLIAGGIMGLTATGKPLPLVEGVGVAAVPVPQPQPNFEPRRVLQPGGISQPLPPVVNAPIVPAPPMPQAAPPPQPQPVEPRKPGLLRRRIPGQE